MEKRLIVGVSGASGAPLALETLRALKAAGVESRFEIVQPEQKKDAGEQQNEEGFLNMMKETFGGENVSVQEEK